MTLPLLDLTDDDGIAAAARGDWHAAAGAFAQSLAAIEGGRPGPAPDERDAHDARLAAALTNLGQARAQLGDLDEAAVLLARSAALRERLVDRGTAGAVVAARGLVDVAAVRAAAGAAEEARAVLVRAQKMLTSAEGDAARTLAHDVAQGIALLREVRR